MPKTRSGGTCPSYGQPNDGDDALAAQPLAARAADHRLQAAEGLLDRAVDVLALWVSDARRNTLISSKRSRARGPCRGRARWGSARTPRRSAGTSIAASTSAASASCGITSGRTKLVTSMRRSPCAPARRSGRSCRPSAMISGSFWKPSRGPTSRTRTSSGRSRVTIRGQIYTPRLARPSLDHRRLRRPRLRPRHPLGRAGVPVAIGSRDAGRAEEAAARAREPCPAATSRAAENAEAAAAAESSCSACRSAPSPRRSPTSRRRCARASSGRRDRPARRRRQGQGDAHARRLAGLRGRSRPQEMVPDGVRVVSALHTVSAARSRTSTTSSTRTSWSAATARPTRSASSALIERDPRACAASTAARWRWRASSSRSPPLLIGDQHPLQDARRDQDHRAARTAAVAGRRARRRHRRRQARPRDARRRRRRPRRRSPTPPTTSRSTAPTSPPTRTSCTFWLADRIDERGWGLRDDTFHVMDGLRELGVDVWFNLGDRDLAIGLAAPQRLARGRAPDRGARRARRGARPRARVLPMSDAPVRTRVLARGALAATFRSS